MDFYHFFSSSKDFTFDFSMSHCYTLYRSEEIGPLWSHEKKLKYVNMPNTLNTSHFEIFKKKIEICKYAKYAKYGHFEILKKKYEIRQIR